MRLPWISLGIAAAACTPDPAPVDTDLPIVAALDQPNAMGLGGHPMLPWPADQYVDEAGPRLAPDAALLPPGYTPGMLAGSGASRVTPIVTWLPGSVDPSSLPDPADWGATLATDSPVRVVVLQAGADPVPWPVLAEIDATAPVAAEATLLIRPHQPFPAGSRVAVGLRTTLRAADGTAHPASEALDRILRGVPASDAEASWTDVERDALLTALPLLGPDATDLAQAWTFTVRGEDEIVGPMFSLQNAAAAFQPTTFTVEPVEYDGNKALVYGTVEVPWFLDATDRLVVDAGGTPVQQGLRSVPFLVTIPDTVSGPRPVVLFGHGFFSAIEEPTWGNLFNGLARWEMSAITTQFFGFAEADLAKAAGALGGDTLEGLAGIIDLQRQSQANFTVVHTLVTTTLHDRIEVDFGDGPFKPLDPRNVPYMGISNGGTQGLVMMATSPVLERGALVVPGGGWSHMLQRAAQWATLGSLFAIRFPDPAELQLAQALSQHVFDPVDSLNFVDHLVRDRLPGLPTSPGLLLVEAKNDAQVANLVTRWIVRASGVPQIVPAIDPVWDAATVDVSALGGDTVRVAYEQYDLQVPDNPPGNVAPVENDVHNDVRLLDAYRAQMGRFLEDGVIVRACDGICDPE